MPSETQSAEFYKMASRMLSDANYNHYEISSYCKSGYECKHNFIYWKNKPFYGFGLCSASFVGGLRFSRPRKVNDYISFVQNLENGLVNSSVKGHISGKDTIMDVVMLSLRTAQGIDLKSFQESFDAEKMREMVVLGVNRVSLGVQAFQEELLRACGRAHGLKEVHEAIDVVKLCGVENWSIDLISSLPHQTSEMWEESLRLAIESQPTHVSVYDLQIEQGTKFGRL